MSKTPPLLLANNETETTETLLPGEKFSASDLDAALPSPTIKNLRDQIAAEQGLRSIIDHMNDLPEYDEGDWDETANFDSEDESEFSEESEETEEEESEEYESEEELTAEETEEEETEEESG